MQAKSPQPITVAVPKPERKSRGRFGEIEQPVGEPRAHHHVAGQHEQRNGDQRERIDALEQRLADQRQRQRSGREQQRDRAEPERHPERHAENEQDHDETASVSGTAMSETTPRTGLCPGRPACRRGCRPTSRTDGLDAANGDQYEADRHGGLRPELVDAQHEGGGAEGQHLVDGVERVAQGDEGEDQRGEFRKDIKVALQPRGQAG